jgi:MFS family permease
MSAAVPAQTIPASPAASEAERQVFAKIGRRLMPILIVSYILNYLDRTNVGFAGLTRPEALGLTEDQLGFGAGVFFLGYCFLELPSNMVLYKVGARVWISRIMISWGLVSAAMSLASGPASFYFLRFLLGAAEAGFFPGIAFYLSTWFPSEYRTRIIAWFMVAIPVSTVIGAPLSALILWMDGDGGLADWQWLFLVEGLPVVLVGLSILWLLPDRPDDAAWLTEEERRIVRERLASERKPKEVRRLGPALTDPRVWMLGGVQFGFLVGSYGILIFFPQMLRDTWGVSGAQAALLTGPSYLCATIGMILWARHVERNGRKIVNLALACALSAAGFVGAAAAGDNFWMWVFGVTVAVVGINGARAIFWTIPPRFLSGVAAAGGLAFINSIGTAGGFVGPNVMGWLVDDSSSPEGFLAMAGFLMLAAALAWALKLFVRGQSDKAVAADL